MSEVKIRRCKNCGCDISHRSIKAKRCVACAERRDARLHNLRRRAKKGAL